MPRFIFLFFILNFNFIYECSSQVDSSSEFEHKKNGFFIPSKPERGRIVGKGSDCEDFKYNLSENYYIDNAGRPYLTNEDTTKIISHAIKTGEIKYALKTKTEDYDTIINAVMYLLPRIRNIYNSNLLNKTTIVAKKKKRYTTNFRMHNFMKYTIQMLL